MQRYLLSRLVQSVLIVLGVLVLVFFMVRVTGDPASLMMPREGATPETLAAFRHKLGFDRPLIVQFLEFMQGAVVGDFGNSIRFKTPALPLVLERLPATVELAALAMLMATVVAIPLGLVAGSRPGSLWDALARGLGLFGQSIPNFVLGMVLIVIVGVWLRLLPVAGRFDLEGNVDPKRLIMPAFVLGLPTMGALVRLTRSAVLEIRGEDYVRTAHSKGLSPRLVYIRHILRNAAIPIISVLGVWFGYLLGGSVYVETVFGYPGVGMILAEAIANRDYTLVQSLAFFICLVVVVLNLVTDLAYAVIDPRIRYKE
jgi:ABC-type dipeptide/oligopeptide/nickel transport system permease component